jgi:hypothetical protein
VGGAEGISGGRVRGILSSAGFTPTAGLVSADQRTPAWDAQFRQAAEISYRQLQLLAGAPGYGVYWIDNYNATDDPTPPAGGGPDGDLVPEHLRTGRLGLGGLRPVATPPIGLGHVGPDLHGRRLDARGLGELLQKRLIALARVPPHDAAHGRVRFECGRIDRDRFPVQQPGVDEPLQHPREDRPVRLHVNQAPGPRNRRMIGRGVVHGQAQKTADRQRVRRPPRDPAFRVDPLEVAEQQQNTGRRCT